MTKKIKILKLDKMFSDYIRKRDNHTCQFCGSVFNQLEKAGLQGLDCSHFWGRASKGTRFDPDNADALCSGCHMTHEPNKQGFYREFKIKQLGQYGYDRLNLKAHSTTKFGVIQQREMELTLKQMLLSVGLDIKGKPIF